MNHMLAMRLVVAGGLLAMSSVSFAGKMQDKYNCQSPDGKIQMLVETLNAPDFDLSTYDSDAQSGCCNTGSVSPMTLTMGGQVVQGARLQAISATDGSTQDVSEIRDGKTCRTGLKTTGIALKAKLSVQGGDQTVDLNCTDDTTLPDGAVECQ